MPKFGEDLNNLTVPVGREAIFICNIENLATYKVFIICLYYLYLRIAFVHQ